MDTFCRVTVATTIQQTEVQRRRALLSASEPRQEVKQRLRLGPTNSCTNILRGVTVTNRHYRVHAHGLTRHSPTQTPTTHEDLTRQNRTDAGRWCPLALTSDSRTRSGPGSSRDGSRAVIPRHAVTPRVPDGESPTPKHSPGAAALTRPARASAEDKSRPRTRPRSPGRPAPAPPRPRPGHLPRRRGQGEPRAQHLPRRPGPRAPGPREEAGPPTTRRGGPEGAGRPAPLPRLCGQQSGRGAGREPGFRLEPQLPVRPPRGRKQGLGRPAQAFLPPSPDGPGTGSA